MQIAVVSSALAAKHFPQEVRPSGIRFEQRNKSFGIDAECERLGEATLSCFDSRFDVGKGFRETRLSVEFEVAIRCAG
jgi:hypothetical protein